MSSMEHPEHEAWTGEERLRQSPELAARHGAADYAVLGFAALFVLAELAWIAFLGYVALRALA